MEKVNSLMHHERQPSEKQREEVREAIKSNDAQGMKENCAERKKGPTLS